MGVRSVSLTGLTASRDGDRIEVQIQGRCWSRYSALKYGLDNDDGMSAAPVGSWEICVLGDFRATTTMPLDDDWDHELEIDTSDLMFDDLDNYDQGLDTGSVVTWLLPW